MADKVKATPHQAVEWVGSELSTRLAYMTLCEGIYENKEALLADVVHWFSKFDKTQFVKELYARNPGNFQNLQQEGLTAGYENRDDALRNAISTAINKKQLRVVYQTSDEEGNWWDASYQNKLPDDVKDETVRYVLPNGEVTKLS